MGVAAALKELFISNNDQEDVSVEVGNLESGTKEALEEYIKELNSSSKKSTFGSSLKVEKPLTEKPKQNNKAKSKKKDKTLKEDKQR